MTLLCAFAVTMPSWVNEKTPTTSANKAVWSASTAAMIIKVLLQQDAVTPMHIHNPVPIAAQILFGLVGAAALGPSRVGSDVLVSIDQLASSGRIHPREAAALARVSVYTFSFFVVGLGIPVLCVLVRYNLISGGVCHHHPLLLLVIVLLSSGGVCGCVRQGYTLVS